jgi:three-Cys-motif partner protein
MAVPKTTRWPLEPHTQTKHLILRCYLDAWLPIMARYNGRIVLLDGFAGPGRYSGGEDGSPLIALKALLDHPHFKKPASRREVIFFFIERDADRAAALEQELEELAHTRPIPDWIKYEVLKGEFAPLVTGVLDDVQARGVQLAPTFAFIDPFGFGDVPMNVIARIVKNPSCECLITFMYESINRFLAHPEEAVQQHFAELFGSREWRELVSEDNRERRRDRLVDLYRHQLMRQAGLKYVRTFEMVNEGNRTEYFLYFGTNHRQGLSKMKQAMWRADPQGGQMFSDRTDTAQGILIGPNVAVELRKLLQERFRATGWVTIEAVEAFVLEETPYSEAMHLKRVTLEPMEREAPPTLEVRRPPGKRNRPGEYPRGTQLRFL